MSRADKAEEYFRKGYNCSQSVVMAFCDVMGMSEETAAKVSVSFGGGTGRMRLTCGALNGAFIVLGVMLSSSDGSVENKNRIYKIVQKAASDFKEKNGSINCGELLTGKGINTDTSYVSEARSETYYKKRPCIGCIRDGVEIAENILREEGLHFI